MTQPSFEIIITQNAKSDLFNIYLYTLEKWGLDQAEIYTKRVKKSVKYLIKNPNIGIRYDFSKRTIRLFFVEKHIVIYYISNNKIYVLRFLHQNQKIKLSLK